MAELQSFADAMVAAVAVSAPPNSFGLTPPDDLNTDFSNVIVVDGLPVAPVAKYEKLVSLIRKTFSKSVPWEG